LVCSIGSIVLLLILLLSMLLSIGRITLSLLVFLLSFTTFILSTTISLLANFGDMVNELIALILLGELLKYFLKIGEIEVNC